MLGRFQQSQLRIEIEASKQAIGDSLLDTRQLSQWLWFGRFSPGLPGRLQEGLTFTSRFGIINVSYQVNVATDNSLRLLLSQGIDGYHEWYWGDGWVQSCVEGISLMPLNLGQTLSLLSLRQFLLS